MPYPLLFDSSYLFVNPRRILMYLYKPSSYNPERIGYEICYHDCLDHVKASINSFFLKEEGYYMWRFSITQYSSVVNMNYCWSLNSTLQPSFKKLTKVKIV